MSKKVFGYMILDSIAILIFTALFLILRHYLGFISIDWARSVLNAILVVIYVIADAIVVFFFLLYWWSDVKWTNIKNKFRKKH